MEKGFATTCALMTLVAAMLCGCGSATTPTTPTANPTQPGTPVAAGKPTPETAVRAAIAEQLEVKADQIALDKPFGSEPLKADELDIIEIVMETEDQLDVEIHDETLDKAAGVSKVGELPSKLTPRMLIQIAAQAKKGSGE